jgi:peroxiredoxin
MRHRTVTAISTIALAFALAWSVGGSAFADDDAKVSEATGNKMMPEVATIDMPAPDFTLTDAEGNKHSLSDFKGKTVVLEWVNFDCPFVKKHYNSGNMTSLQSAFTEKGVVWLSINSSAPEKQGNFTGEALTDRMAAEKWHGSAYLIDSDGTVGKKYEAKTTPHMFVIDKEGVLRYMGAIDDTPSTDVDDIEGANNYVVSALNNVLTGKSVETKATKSYGCPVKY